MAIRYLLPETGNLYKANLHCHSTVSDGKFSPEALKEMYMAKGYHAIAYTDHRIARPHTELTDESFVALTGIEIASMGNIAPSCVHACGISRDPDAEIFIENTVGDYVTDINRGIAILNEKNCITTLNHPRWSGTTPEMMKEIKGYKNIEVLNGYEDVNDGYGDCSETYEAELRRGNTPLPVATDDSHSTYEGGAGLEYFRGFTMIKARELTYSALIEALDSGSFYASSGPIIKELWIEDGVLHIECSPVSGIYLHGKRYTHRKALVSREDVFECADIDLCEKFSDSDYVYVQIATKDGKKAWSAAYSLKGIFEK